MKDPARLWLGRIFKPPCFFTLICHSTGITRHCENLRAGMVEYSIQKNIHKEQFKHSKPYKNVRP